MSGLSPRAASETAFSSTSAPRQKSSYFDAMDEAGASFRAPCIP
jgi:hypothetical protein